MTYPIPNIYYSTDGVLNNGHGSFSNWLAYVLGQVNTPQTTSTTYGKDEYNFLQDHGCSHHERHHDYIPQVAMYKITVLKGSEDVDKEESETRIGAGTIRRLCIHVKKSLSRTAAA
ncbi:hypothetical protein H4582DRAFT_1968920 [Lactarius indigo]|nr:hypothetical protein H4582DRAFT_1968920 [Lactarius indigo]